MNLLDYFDIKDFDIVTLILFRYFTVVLKSLFFLSHLVVIMLILVEQLLVCSIG